MKYSEHKARGGINEGRHRLWGAEKNRAVWPSTSPFFFPFFLRSRLRLAFSSRWFYFFYVWFSLGTSLIWPLSSYHCFYFLVSTTYSCSALPRTAKMLRLKKVDVQTGDENYGGISRKKIWPVAIVIEAVSDSRQTSKRREEGRTNNK